MVKDFSAIILSTNATRSWSSSDVNLVRARVCAVFAVTRCGFSDMTMDFRVYGVPLFTVDCRVVDVEKVPV